MSEIISTLNNLIWSTPFIIFCISIGLYFSIKTGFLQIRYFREMIRLLFKEKTSDKGVSPFQAFSLAIAGRVGVGNIAGVAMAIYMGGPGAVFWMWFIAFIGSATAFAEAALAQVYKVQIDGEYRGGPAYYIEKGLGVRWYGVLFAVFAIISCSFFLPGLQANSIGTSLHDAFAWDKDYIIIGLIVLLALVIIGTAKKIATVAEIMVPIMAGAYIIMALIIIGYNIEKVPAVFELIFKSAFNLEASMSGMIGAAIAWGVKRGIYSNEAGQGSAPHAAAAAATSHPAKQGLVQAFSVYVDTLFVCTATALIILFTGQYNVQLPEGTLLVENLPNVEAGTKFTVAAIATHFQNIADKFVAISIFFFAFTTIIAYYFIAESNIKFLFRKVPRVAAWIVRAVMFISIYVGIKATTGEAWDIGDIGVGLMAWTNLIALILLRKKVFLVFNDYIRQKKEGRNPTFDPKSLGIHNTSEWESDADSEPPVPKL